MTAPTDPLLALAEKYETRRDNWKRVADRGDACALGHYEQARDIAADLRAHLADGAPAAGEWVMVPREPTPEMSRAGTAELPERMRHVFGDKAFAFYVYRAMLTAAPARPEAGLVLSGYAVTDIDGAFDWSTGQIFDTQESAQEWIEFSGCEHAVARVYFASTTPPPSSDGSVGDEHD